MADEPQPKRLRTTRACDYCREHRIRCEYAETDTSCRHCEDYGIKCEKVAKAPQDHRPRSKRKGHPEFDKATTHQGIEPGYLGATSASQLIYDHISGSTAEDRLLRLDSRLDVYTDAFDGNTGRLIGRHPDVGETARRRAIAETTYQRAEERLVLAVGGNTVLDTLYATCQRRILPVFPAVSVHESLGSSDPSPFFLDYFGGFHTNSTPPTPLPKVLRLIMCSLAAFSRIVPWRICEALTSALNTVLDSMEFSMGMASLTHVQLHLLMFVNDGLWKRGPMGRAVYGATRMAVGLALHRRISSRTIPAAQLNRRNRIWGACIIADRWTTLRLGQMPSLDLGHADADPPSEYGDHRLPHQTDLWPSFRLHLEMTKLADLLGRAYDLMSSPFGIARADDISLLSWQLNFEAWRDQVPSEFPYSHRLSTPEARPILDLLSAAVLHTFLSPFIYSTQDLPEAITYEPPTYFQELLIQLSRQSIDWMCGAGSFYLDVFSCFLHPLIICILVQAKAAQVGDPEASESVEKGVKAVREWAQHGQSPAYMCYTRVDIIEMVELIQRDPDPAPRNLSPFAQFE